MKKILLLCLAVLLCVNIAFAEDGTISVTGTATITVEADRASLTLGVRTNAKDAAEAAQMNADKVKKVIDALAEAGIPEEKIKTAYYYVSPVYDYSSFSEEAAIKGYQVSNTLTVSVDEIERVGSIIDVALDHGANSCDGVTFQSAQSRGAYDQALMAAIEEGRRKAELMAKAMGGTLGDLISCNESSGNYTGARFARSAAITEDTAVGASTQIISEGLDFSATVQMTYSLREAEENE